MHQEPGPAIDTLSYEAKTMHQEPGPAIDTLSYEEPKPEELARTIVVHLSPSDLDAITYAIDHVLYGEPDLLPATNHVDTDAPCDVSRMRRLLELQAIIEAAR
jgi:hypothetical protein